jgi:hypothetical protein
VIQPLGAMGTENSRDLSHFGSVGILRLEDLNQGHPKLAPYPLYVREEFRPVQGLTQPPAELILETISLEINRPGCYHWSLSGANFTAGYTLSSRHVSSCDVMRADGM